MRLFTVLFFASTLSTVTAQSFIEAISKYPQLANFTSLYNNNTSLGDALFNNKTLYPVTVLVPDDNAFAAYQQNNSVSLTELSLNDLLSLLQYHTLVTDLGRDNFTNPSGTTAPTLLQGANFNNRSVGSSLADKFGGAAKSSGQVVYVGTADASNPSKFIIRQANNAGASSVRSGLNTNVNLTILDDSDGTWDGGRFHIIDGLLTLPQRCSTTIRDAGMNALDGAINRTSLWSTLDFAQNITCLGPNDDAFKAAGNIQQGLDVTNLSDVLLRHTLPQVAYSDFLTDGQEFTSLQNMTIKVRVQGSGSERQIYFNNAKVVDANVLAQNGLMHILDSVIQPLNQSSATPTASGTPHATGSAKSGAGGSKGDIRMTWVCLGLLAVFGAMLFL